MLVIADLITLGLIAGDWRALWGALAFATCVCVAWYVQFVATDADAGLLDGLILSWIALAVAATAVAAGVLLGRLFR